MGVTYTFLAIGAIDHRRRAASHRLLGDLFRPGVNGRAPPLALDSTPQAHAFLATRGLLRAFGEAFHERLVLVISSSLVVFCGLAVYCLIALYLAAGLSLVVSSIILLHVLVLPAFVCCALGLHEAAAVNEQLRRHVALFVDARVRLRLAADASAPLDDRVLGLLEAAQQQMAEQQLTQPVSILGFPASAALTKAFLGAWVSLESAALTITFIWATGVRRG